MSVNDSLPNIVRAGVDLGFVGAFLGWVMGLLPGALLILGVLWYAVQLWECNTGVKLRLWIGHKLVRSFLRFEAHEPAHVTEIVPVIEVRPVPLQSPSEEGPAPSTPA